MRRANCLDPSSPPPARSSCATDSPCPRGLPRAVRAANVNGSKSRDRDRERKKRVSQLMPSRPLYHLSRLHLSTCGCNGHALSVPTTAAADISCRHFQRETKLCDGVKLDIDGKKSSPPTFFLKPASCSLQHQMPRQRVTTFRNRWPQHESPRDPHTWCAFEPVTDGCCSLSR
ncbi:hypothetical protein IF2G_07608 [Cordyceps javanica]|nr:hypothetical protein IF2G_07608 [Cordyceps javanica]